MTKEILYEKVFKNEFSQAQLLTWIKGLENNVKLKPKFYKIGDIFHHAIFNHPIVLVKKKENSYICLMLTSNEILEAKTPSESRFIEGFIASVLIEVHVDNLKNHKFIGLYDNNKHLNEVYRHLKIIL